MLTSFLPHKKFTWTDIGGIYTQIPPLRPCCLFIRSVAEEREETRRLHNAYSPCTFTYSDECPYATRRNPNINIYSSNVWSEYPLRIWNENDISSTNCHDQPKKLHNNAGFLQLLKLFSIDVSDGLCAATSSGERK